MKFSKNETKKAFSSIGSAINENLKVFHNHKITQKMTAHSDCNETTMITRQKL